MGTIRARVIDGGVDAEKVIEYFRTSHLRGVYYFIGGASGAAAAINGRNVIHAMLICKVAIQSALALQ
ncbi:hypothetical protein F6P93_02125 [Escherichia coli]|nr:hypothetical protein F6P93_02125 [Escherichia coli]